MPSLTNGSGSLVGLILSMKWSRDNPSMRDATECHDSGVLLLYWMQRAQILLQVYRFVLIRADRFIWSCLGYFRQDTRLKWRRSRIATATGTGYIVSFRSTCSDSVESLISLIATPIRFLLWCQDKNKQCSSTLPVRSPPCRPAVPTKEKQGNSKLWWSEGKTKLIYMVMNTFAWILCRSIREYMLITLQPLKMYAKRGSYTRRGLSTGGGEMVVCRLSCTARPAPQLRLRLRLPWQAAATPSPRWSCSAGNRTRIARTRPPPLPTETREKKGSHVLTHNTRVWSEGPRVNRRLEEHGLVTLATAFGG